MTVYLDCNATTPIEPEVSEIVRHYMEIEYGNAGSRTHEFGQRAADAVKLARQQIAAVVEADPSEVIFTSGATEGLNLAILGLTEFGLSSGKRHIISTAIEHKAVLEPLDEMKRRGFEITLIPPTAGGYVEPSAVRAALREDTLLVAVMQINNETGMIQPTSEIADELKNHDAYFLVDAAQGFGKDLPPLRNKRIDLMAVSSHKVYGPKGVGALIMRTRSDYKRAPLKPIMFGGGQERGLRPGTLPVALIAGFGKAAELALRDNEARRKACQQMRDNLLAEIGTIPHVIIGDQLHTAPHAVSLAFEGLNSEAAMLALKELVAVSNGSACTSANYSPSHVLLAMGLDQQEARSALRVSWSHMTPASDWTSVRAALLSIVE